LGFVVTNRLPISSEKHTKVFVKLQSNMVPGALQPIINGLAGNKEMTEKVDSLSLSSFNPKT
jgi:hypothetical protein